MAKSNTSGQATPAPKGDQIVVRPHFISQDGRSPDQGEVLVNGKRVAYISYAPPHPVSFLPPSHLGVRIETPELEEICKVAREQVAKLAAAAAADQERIRKLLTGE